MCRLPQKRRCLESLFLDWWNYFGFPGTATSMQNILTKNVPITDVLLSQTISINKTNLTPFKYVTDVFIYSMPRPGLTNMNVKDWFWRKYIINGLYVSFINSIYHFNGAEWYAHLWIKCYFNQCLITYFKYH